MTDVLNAQLRAIREVLLHVVSKLGQLAVFEREQIVDILSLQRYLRLTSGVVGCFTVLIILMLSRANERAAFIKNILI